jgi:capsular polysaccharide biosynthesis protein
MKLRFPGRSGDGRALRWWGWAIVAGVLLGVLAGFAGYQQIVGAPYVSSAQVLVTGRFSDSQVDSALSANQYVDQRMSTYAEVATSEQVTGPVARVLGSDPDTVAQRITATVAGDTTVITLAVQGDTPEQAMTGAAAVTRSFITAIGKLETVGGGTASRVTMSVISNPSTPPGRDLPVLPVWLAGGVVLLVGLALGAGWLVRWLFPKWQQAQGVALPVVDTAAEVVVEPVVDPVVDPVPRQVLRTGSERVAEPAGAPKRGKPGGRPAAKGARQVGNGRATRTAPAGADDHDRNGPPTIEIPQTTARRSG